MEKKTSVLLVTGGDDFHANTFENEHSGKQVKEIIDNLSEYESDEWELSVHTFYGEIDPKFIEFIKRHIQDYDHSKTTNFYMEGDAV